MSAKALEELLARLYSDPDAFTRFRANPRAEALRAGVSPEECDALIANLDWAGLELAARSFARKRERAAAEEAGRAGWLGRLVRRLGLRVRVRRG